jgi:putative ABC transport system ATP-binding protein
MIELNGISRIFTMGDQEVRALDHIDLSIASGEYVSVMGPSGSGKSTLLNIIGLLDQPSSGTYRLENRDVTALSEAEQAKVRRERIGFIFQAFHLVPRLTAAENIELPLVLEGLPPAERQARVKAALEQTDLVDRAHHRPAELSGGERQRVAIARATILEPAVLLADEPTGNLDHKTGAEVVELLEKLHHAGTTVIVVTHDRELGGRAHRRIQMRDGEIIEDTSPKLQERRFAPSST